MIETQEDIYVGSIETDRGVREQVRFYDTRGLRDGMELPKHCFSCTDGYVLVYSTDSKESFKRVELLKKEIDKSKDKKEVSTRDLPRGKELQEWGLLPCSVVLAQSLLSPGLSQGGDRESCSVRPVVVTGCCAGMLSGESFCSVTVIVPQPTGRRALCRSRFVDLLLMVGDRASCFVYFTRGISLKGVYRDLSSPSRLGTSASCCSAMPTIAQWGWFDT